MLCKSWIKLALNSNWFVLAAFGALVFSLRLYTFYNSTMNWDESLYVLVSNAWLNGNPPYTTVWDNKPPGIYILFSLALLISNHSLVAIRALTCLAVLLNSMILLFFGNKLFPDYGRLIGFLAGLFFILATLNNGGIASNTEVFYLPFSTLAILLLFSNLLDKILIRRDKYVNLDMREEYRDPFSSSKDFLFIGLLLGVGFEIKYSVLFDFLSASSMLGIVILYLWHQKVIYSIANVFWAMFKNYAFLLIGFLFPFVLVTLYFYAIGHLDSYLFANFEANANRTIGNEFSLLIPLSSLIEQFRFNLLFWLSFFTAFVCIFKGRNLSIKERWLIGGLLLWLVIQLGCIFILFRAHIYSHYFLQLAPGLALLSAYMLIALSRWLRTSSRFPQKIQLSILLVLITFHVVSQSNSHLMAGLKYAYYRHVKDETYWGDYPALIAHNLNSKIGDNSLIYVVDYEPILYFLVDAKIPTEYVFPPFLVQRIDLGNITGVDPLAELSRIMAQEPAYVIAREDQSSEFYIPGNKIFFESLNIYLGKNYVMTDKYETWSGNVILYRHKEENLS